MNHIYDHKESKLVTLKTIENVVLGGVSIATCNNYSNKTVDNYG